MKTIAAAVGFLVLFVGVPLLFWAAMGGGGPR